MRRLLTNAALLGASLLLALALAELFLRVFAPIPYSMKVEFVADPHVAFRLVPGRVYQLASGGKCTVNSEGYRGREVEIPKPAGTFRIAVLGGSSTFCYLTDDGVVWTSRLEAKLRERVSPAIEVVNAGVPGYSTFESTIHYLYRVRALEPDAVIVYHTWNDLKLFRDLEEKGRLQKGTYQPKPLRSFLRQFQLAWRVRTLFGGGGELAPRELDWLEGRPDDAFSVPPGGVAQRFAERGYEDIATLVRADGALPILLSQAGLLADENQGDPAIRERVYTEFAGLDYREVLAQWEVLTGMIERAAGHHQGVYVDVYDAVPHDLRHFRDHVHLTDRGNEAVAAAVADALADSPRFRRALVGSGVLAGVGVGGEQLPVGAPQEDQADGGVE